MWYRGVTTAGRQCQAMWYKHIASAPAAPGIVLTPVLVVMAAIVRALVVQRVRCLAEGLLTPHDGGLSCQGCSVRTKSHNRWHVGEVAAGNFAVPLERGENDGLVLLSVSSEVKDAERAVETRGPSRDLLELQGGRADSGSVHVRHDVQRSAESLLLFVGSLAPRRLLKKRSVVPKERLDVGLLDECALHSLHAKPLGIGIAWTPSIEVSVSA